MGMKKVFKSSLVRDVVTSYIWMIVFPVMIVLGIAFVVASRYIYSAAMDSVAVAQNSVLALYEDEIRSTSIALSHVVNMNGGTTIREAAKQNGGEQEKEALKQLDTMFHLLAAPEYSLLDIQIYRKDKTAVIPRWQMRYSQEELREKAWYQAALKQPGQVYCTLEDKDYFYRIRSSQEAMLVAAFVPEDMPEIECVALYKLSKIPDTLKKYNRSGGIGQIYVVNQYGVSLPGEFNGQIVPEQVMEKLRESKAEEIQVSWGGIRYIAREIPKSGRYVVSLVDQWEMLGQFGLFSLVSLIVIFGVVLLFIVYFRWYMDRLLVPLGGLTEGMKEVERHNLDVRVDMCRQEDIASMISIFNSMVGQIRQLILEKEHAEKEKYQEELHALQSQMNPHFLMNTLNTLKFMAISAHFDGMRDMVDALENILAAILNRDGGFYRLSDEKSVLDSYIYIMQFRYMDSFEVDIHISEEALMCKVPKLILQPIVENSITHGFDGLEEKLGLIVINGRIEEDRLVLEVRDNGKGMDREQIARILTEPGKPKGRRTIGVSNTDRRIKLNFGPQYGVDIQSEPGSFTAVRLILPVIRPEDNAGGSTETRTEKGERTGNKDDVQCTDRGR
ncbi:sensor histidine kinase [Lacrimispora sp. 210928-DFI.3.58]|uniref:sensor histidine kinase n=1 Tax=Lacrimispora sp. 210928-DFI.3.58 TaxID=2883214 RepID=UPI001D095C12|nr:histidine kinase [Lacrimispora sp. 210928-DFI.3.58]MCB7317484.1 histidine kinase [Lacrimispora sp. 210928-DFI.3.58]